MNTRQNVREALQDQHRKLLHSRANILAYVRELRGVVNTLPQELLLHLQRFTNELGGKDTSILQQLGELEQQLEVTTSKNYLMIVGETSSGKSTLINLILGTQLLPSAAHATTSCQCEIYYHPTGLIQSIDSNGVVLATRTFTDVEQAYEYLSEIVNIEDGRLANTNLPYLLKIGWPVPILQDTNLVILDTPGITEDVAFYNQMAVRRIVESSAQCFGIIATINSSVGGFGESYTELIKELVRQGFPAHSIHFVATKWDTVGEVGTRSRREEERRRTIAMMESAIRRCVGAEWHVASLLKLEGSHRAVWDNENPDESHELNSWLIRFLCRSMCYPYHRLCQLLRACVMSVSQILKILNRTWQRDELQRLRKRIATMETMRSTIEQTLVDIKYRAFEACIPDINRHMDQGRELIIEKTTRSLLRYKQPDEKVLVKELIPTHTSTAVRHHLETLINEQLSRTITDQLEAMRDESLDVLAPVYCELQAIISNLGLAEPEEGGLNGWTTAALILGSPLIFLVAVGAAILTLAISIPVGIIIGIPAAIIGPIVAYFQSRKSELLENPHKFLHSHVAACFESMDVKAVAELILNQTPECVLVQTKLQLLPRYIAGLNQLISVVECRGSVSNAVLEAALERTTTISSLLAREQMLISPSTLNLDLLQVGDRIGGGAFGEVFQGVYDEQPVAVKVIRPAAHNGAVHWPSLIKEVESLSVSDHENIIKVHGYHYQQDPRQLTVVTSLCSRTLAWHIQQPNCRANFCRYAIAAARGLAHLHKLDIVHRDLKPDNMMTDENDTLKIIDFGLATHISQLNNTFCGSILYMAPEVLDSCYSKMADVYSFGRILFELWYGHQWFRRENMPHENTLAAWRTITEIQPAFNDPVPPGQLQSLITSCWAAPSARPTFRTIVKILEEIERAGF